MKTVGNLKDSVGALLTGINLNNVSNLDGAIERAARTLVQKADIPEASGRQSITLYSGVYDYTAPSTIFGGALLDFRPQGASRTQFDYVYKEPIELFDRTKKLLPNGYALTFEYRNGTPRMRVVSPKPTPRVILDPLSATTGWTAGGSASSLALDSSIYYESTGSLRMTLTGASSGYIEKTLTNSVDLTTYQGVGVVFVAIYTPSATDLTSINIRLGSSSSNYYSVSNTTGFLGAWLANDWTLVALDLSQATTTGSPTITAIDYVRVTATHGATLTNFRVGALFISLPSAHEVLFQSSAIFMATDTPSLTITTDKDSILLNEAAYTLLEYESAMTIAVQAGGTLNNGLVQMLNQQLHGTRARNGAMIQAGLYDMYRADNPSQELRMVGTYYET